MSETFITNTQKRVGLAVIQALRTQPHSNACQVANLITDRNLSSVVALDCLKELQISEVVSCEIIRKSDNEPMVISDYFTLTDKTEDFERLLKTPPFTPAHHVNVGTRCQFEKKYVVFLCQRCGAAGYMRTEQKGSMCRHCGQRNELFLKTMKVLLWTDDVNEAMATVQVSKFKQKTFKVKQKLQRL